MTAAARADHTPSRGSRWPLVCRGVGLGCASACSGESGTLAVTLTTAPGSTLLDAVQTLELTVTNPRKVFTAERTSAGFSLALELEATGEAASLLVRGLDA